MNTRGEVNAPAEPAAEPSAAPAGDPSLAAQVPLVPGAPAVDPEPALKDPLAADPVPAVDPAVPAAPAVKKWYDNLSEDVRNNPTIQKYNTQEDAHKAHLELASMLGHEKVALPKDENDTVAIEAFNRAIGVPDEAIGERGYNLEAPEAIAGMEDMQFGSDQFKEIAFKYKLTPAQAQGLQNEYVELLTGIKTQSEADYLVAVNQSKTDLTSEWGLAYDGKVKLAQNLMNKFAGSKENFDYINAKIGADPIALKMLAEIGANFSEGSLGDLGNPSSSFTKTPSEAKIEYDTIMNDPKDIYWAGVRNKEIVPESVRKERVAHVESLLTMMNPATPGTPAAG